MPHPLRLLLIWLGVLSTLSFLLYGWDKAQAKLHRRRIPEAALLFCALLGGSAGALLGMALFRHKIRKPPLPVRRAPDAGRPRRPPVLRRRTRIIPPACPAISGGAGRFLFFLKKFLRSC